MQALTAVYAARDPRESGAALKSPKRAILHRTAVLASLLFTCTGGEAMAFAGYYPVQATGASLPLDESPGAGAARASPGGSALTGFRIRQRSTIFGLDGEMYGHLAIHAMTSSRQIDPTLLSPASTSRPQRSDRSSFDWSARGRIGYMLDRTLLYATAGVAGLRARVRGNVYSITSGSAGIPAHPVAAQGPFLTTAQGPRNMVGWTGGVGLVRRMASFVSVTAEARYSEYSSGVSTLASATTPSAARSARSAAAAMDSGASGGTHFSVSDARAVVRLALNF